MSNIVHLKQYLIELESYLRKLKLWEKTSPGQNALRSLEPFSVDTLRPEQWLQWVFIPKMLQLIEHDQPLPCGFDITPYFEESWKGQTDKAEVLKWLRVIDEVCR